MTVTSTSRRAGPFLGNGATTTFSFTFKTFAAGDLRVIKTSTIGIETVLVLASDYNVTLNPDQDASPGGTIAYPVSGLPLASGEKLTVLGDLDYEQTTDLLGGGAFNARVIEDTFDRTVIQIQQLKEITDRCVTIPASTSASAVLPTPEPLQVLGWNASGTALTNLDPTDFLTVAGSSGFATQVFSGTGAQTAFTLSENPGAIANLEVFISGVRQAPATDYTVSGTTLTFSSAPPAGTGNILARWGTTLGIGVPADGAVTPAKMASGGAEFGRRNKIINGKMGIAQRGTSFAAPSFGSYTLDRWAYLGGGTSAVVTVSQQADAPSDNEFQNSLRVAVTTADTSIAAGDNAFISQAIEGFNVRDFIGRSITLSFSVRSSKTGVHCVSFRNSGVNRSYVAEFMVSAANTWERKTVNVPAGLITAGTWDWTNGVGLYLGWALAAGSTFQTTAGAWQTGSFLATANQVNCLDTIGNIFAITGIQIEAGGVATPFEHRPYAAELALCQRYFCKSYSASSAPGAVVVDNAVFIKRVQSSATDYFSAEFPVAMRATPSSITLYSPDTGASGKIREMSAVSDVNATTQDSGDKRFTIAWTASAGSPYRFHYAASAEL